MGAGWRSLFKDKGKPWDTYLTSEDFRQRHLTEALSGVITTLLRTARR
jgi:hypothetical protein